MRSGLELILDQRGTDMADVPGGASGLLVRDYRRKKADRLVLRIDPGVVSLLAGLGGHERQAAEDLGQWKTRVEEHKPLDASQAAITFALLLTDGGDRGSGEEGTGTGAEGAGARGVIFIHVGASAS